MRLVLLFLWAALAMSSHAAEPGRSGLGINIDTPRYWLSDWSFIDEFKRAGGWFTQCDTQTPQCRDFAPGASARNTKEQASLALDANGWVRRLPHADDPTIKFRSVAALLFQGNGGSHPAGRYVVLYDGEGDIAYEGAGKKQPAESRPGRDVLDVTNKPGAGLTIRITRIRQDDPLRNIRVIGPGGVCSDAPLVHVMDAARCAGHGAFKSLEQLHATQMFHPAFVSDLHGFRVLRFMQWGAINGSRLSSWDARPKLTDAMWSGDYGVPVEAMLELANATGADPWLNVPTQVDDDYVRQLARLTLRLLKPHATVHFEYGNEPWNMAPPYNQAGLFYERNARALWPQAAAEPPWRLQLNWYAFRSVQLCRVMKKEFGAQAGRVKCIANSQAANTTATDTMLDCELAKENLGGRCSRELDALAIAPYFGRYLDDPANAAVVDRWREEPDGGLTMLFRELTGRDQQGQPVTPPLYAATGRTPRGGALDQARERMLAQKQIADAHGLPLVAYEGGQHLIVHRGSKAQALFLAANHDPRMGAALQRNLDDWKAAGGQLFVEFSYTVRSGAYGFWGLKEHQLDDQAPKWQAVKALRDQPCWWSGCGR